MEVKEQVESLAKGWEDFKKINEARESEIKRLGTASTETEAKLAKANEAIDAAQKQIEAMKVAISRPSEGTKETVNKEEIERKAAFGKYIRKGIEEKALSANSDTDGGFLIIPEISSEIVKRVYESSPVRQLATVDMISSDTFEINQDLDQVSSGWVSETGARATTGTAKLKQVVIPLHELYAFPTATQKILDDAMWNLEQWLGGKVSEKFIRDEASAFVNGDGVGKPRGFLTYAAATGVLSTDTLYNQIEQVNSGNATLITADGLIGLTYTLKGPYQANASFLMKRVTMGSVRKLKDTQNRYLWEPSLQLGQPDMLFGRPLYLADDMPIEAANALPIAYGDFRSGYQVVDKNGIRILRDPFTAKPYVGFYTTKRVGGGVKNFEAIKLLKCST